jgi:hypothetical protein
MPIVLDGGYVGNLRSLAGRLGRYGRGIKLESQIITLVNGLYTIVLPANGDRLWAIIQSGNPTENCALYYGQDNAYPVCTLLPYGSLQVDGSIPWTGAIYGYALVVAGYALWVSEASVQP